MVQQDRFQYEMKNILEAKTLLVVRAAKRVHYRLGNVSDQKNYLDALQREFEADHIRFKKEEPQPEEDLPSRRLKKDYLCFGNMLVRTINGNVIPENDILNFRKELKRLNLQCGLIVGFSDDGIVVERVTLTESNKHNLS
ncbi:MAG: hypothetical protein R3C41_01365 [Calditrichia bacterium]|nr:hypothetical protein [Calditrichota bacterium]MCB0269128.1 hypothetical protein [Calditrichota bacterium]